MSFLLRVKIVIFGFFLVAILILGRLFYWQVVRSDELALAAQKQHSSFREIPASRGEILASDKFPLAVNQEVFLLHASLANLKKSEAIEKLTPLLVREDMEIDKVASLSASIKDLKKIKAELLSTRLNKQGAVWVPLQHRVSRETKQAIENLQIDGLGFDREQERVYPEGTASAHLLGFLGNDAQGHPKGYFGLEGFYDLQLRGRSGLIQREKDASGKPILFGFSRENRKRDGRDLQTTIDRTVQLAIQKKLEQGIKRYGALAGTVTVMDPLTGAIVGMVSLPTYDPVKFFQHEEESFINPVVADSYEPGSTFKIVVMAAALDSGAVTPYTKCDKCDGPRQISGYTINTWNDRYFPNSTVTDILVHSDNVGMIFVGESLGIKKFHQYLVDFGFSQLTGVDLQEESSPDLRAVEDWKKIDLATASFGQGIAVTRLQMIRAAAAIANGGLLVKPHLVSKIIEDDKVIPVEQREVKRIIKQETTELISEMMVKAVDQGEAKWAKPKNFKIAGKTGTAQIPVAGHYDEDKTIASFIGFAPPEKARFVMLVTLNEPSSSPWGSETAAPLWFDIAEDLFVYYGIAPE